MIDRRRVLLGALGAVLGAGCGGTNASTNRPVAPALPPLKIASVADLLPVARLRWVIVARPRELAATPFLIPGINRVVSEASFARFAEASGLDLRQLTEAAVATYASEDGQDVTAYVVRHNVAPAVVERAFRARLVGGEHRILDRADVVRFSGKFGTSTKTLALLGSDVAVFQDGGSMGRGPARIATLYALDRLKKSPTLFAEEPLKGLAARFGPAPARAFALGPFEGELARGARGLLAGATGIGAAARPSARDRIALSIAVAGDFSKSGQAASKELAEAWNDVANESFGHLLGLDAPLEKPLATFSDDAVALALELDPDKLAKGLAAATSERIDQIMK